ncbi:MAG: DUF488 domain-containing protein [Candidatus Cloacimonadota bacterium]|nr:MAG: DUF488 domain-containing protein [Candidatus Cloacimonadota bacterium]
MYYRQKVLLSLLQHLGGKVKNTDFQKYLFLFTKNSNKNYYHFVPYKYGCFSFISYADKRTLTKYGILENEELWVLKRNVDYLSMLRDVDRDLIIQFKKSFGHLKRRRLIRHIYSNYPYYAINSEIARKHMSKKQLTTIKNSRNTDNSTKMFTIGYEGRTLDEYLNILIKNNVRLLCDVRKNAISRKYGFSKKKLKKVTGEVNIKYEHIPDLGIESNQRKEAIQKSNYEKLFKEYLSHVYNSKQRQISYIKELLRKYRRIALTCFEQDHSMCHRSKIIEALTKLSDLDCPVSNL